MKYAINEIFKSIQGEGSYTGSPVMFIRLQGCSVGCAWCDTKHSWDDGDYFMTIDELIDQLIFIEKIEEGLEQSKEGKVLSNEDVKEIIEKWSK